MIFTKDGTPVKERDGWLSIERNLLDGPSRLIVHRAELLVLKPRTIKPE